MSKNIQKKFSKPFKFGTALSVIGLNNIRYNYVMCNFFYFNR